MYCSWKDNWSDAKIHYERWWEREGLVVANWIARRRAVLHRMPGNLPQSRRPFRGARHRGVDDGSRARTGVGPSKARRDPPGVRGDVPGDLRHNKRGGRQLRLRVLHDLGARNGLPGPVRYRGNDQPRDVRRVRKAQTCPVAEIRKGSISTARSNRPARRSRWSKCFPPSSIPFSMQSDLRALTSTSTASTNGRSNR